MREIMVIDDRAEVGAIFRRLFGRRGDQIRFATTAEAALADLEAGRPALIVLDVNMPEINGFTLCRQLKEDARWSDLPVALFTAWDRPGDVAEGLRAGADYFLSKDLEDDALVERVEEILGHAANPASTAPGADGGAALENVEQAETATIARALEQSFRLAVERNVTGVIGLEAARLIFARAAERVRKQYPFVLDMLHDGLWLDTSRLPSELTAKRREHLMAGLWVFLQEMLALLGKVTGREMVEKVQKELFGHLVVH